VIGNEYIHRFNRALSYNSGLESRCTMMLLSDRTIVDMREEWPRVAYWDPRTNSRHTHIVDRHVTYDSGFRLAISVKANAHLEDSDALEIAKLIRDQNTGEHFDSIVVMTEDEITLPRSDNGEQIVIACDNRNENHCAAVLAFMRSIHRPITFMEVCRTLGDDLDVWNSLLCLIYDGFIEHLSPDDTFDDAPFIQTIFN
jgi:hypothetical protein